MSEVIFACTNPTCQRPLAFDHNLAGSVQQCPHCEQRVIVPAILAAHPQATIVPTVVPIASQPSTMSPPPHLPYFREQERQTELRTARKLNMGSGCFAMLAVMFAMSILGYGIGLAISSTIPGFNSGLLTGLMAILAGLLGLLAFVFFGYIATETASTSRGNERR